MRQKKPAKNAHKINFLQVQKWSKNVFAPSKIDFFWYFRMPQSKYVMCVLPFGHAKSRFFHPSAPKTVQSAGRPFGRPQKRAKTRLSAIKCCRSPVFCRSSVWNSNLMSTSPSQSSADIKKPEKNAKKKNHSFLALLYVHKYVRSARKAFWEAAKSVKNMSVGRLMKPVACISADLRYGSRI